MESYYGNLTHQGLTVEDSIIGPGFMQGIILGDSGWINTVTVRNSLFVGYRGGYGNAGFLLASAPGTMHRIEPRPDDAGDDVEGASSGLA